MPTSAPPTHLDVICFGLRKERGKEMVCAEWCKKDGEITKSCSLLPVVRRRFLLPTAGTLPRTSCIELKSWQEQEVGRQRREDAVCVSERFRMSKQEVKPKFLELCSGKKDSIIDLRGC